MLSGFFIDLFAQSLLCKVSRDTIPVEITLLAGSRSWTLSAYWERNEDVWDLWGATDLSYKVNVYAYNASIKSGSTTVYSFSSWWDWKSAEWTIQKGASDHIIIWLKAGSSWWNASTNYTFSKAGQLIKNWKGVKIYDVAWLWNGISAYLFGMLPNWEWRDGN